MFGVTADTGFEYHLSATFTAMHELFSGKDQLLYFSIKMLLLRKKDPWGP